MGVMVSQITSLTIVYSTVYWGADQRKHQSSASLAFVPGMHRGPVKSPHKGPVTPKMFPFDDVIMFASADTWYDGNADLPMTFTQWGRDKNGRHFAEGFFKRISFNENK